MSMRFRSPMPSSLEAPETASPSITNGSAVIGESRERLLLADLCQQQATLAAQLQQMRASRSWALTRPLRRFYARWHPAPAWSAPALRPADTLPTPPSPYRCEVPSSGQRLRTLLVDVTCLASGSPWGGCARVSRRILGEWLIEPPAGWVVEPVRLAADGGYAHARAFLAEFTGRPPGSFGPDARCRPDPSDVFIALDLVRDHAKAHALALAGLRDAGVRVAAVVYDLLPLEHSDWFPADSVQRFADWWQATLHHADRLCCISGATARAVRAWLGTVGREPAKLHSTVFPLGGDVPSYPLAGEPPSPVAARSLRLLSVGTLEPRKGYAEMLKAFQQAWADGVELQWTLVGRPGWGVEALATEIEALQRREPRLRWYPDAGDVQLSQAYASHDALLLGSHAEGYGLPVAEARSVGLPLLLRDIPVFREAAGPRALFFGGPNQPSLASLLTSPGLAHRLVPSVSGSTWADAARALLQAATTPDPYET